MAREGVAGPTAPLSVKKLQMAIADVAKARGVPERRIRTAVANAVVGQLLPGGVVKGGTGLKLRVGERASRFTPDLDTAFDGDLTKFESTLGVALGQGWGGTGARFTGSVKAGRQASPAGVPREYVMHPFSVKLKYNGGHWLTVDLEVGHDEIQCTANPELVIADDIVELFTSLGLASPGPVPVITVEHQLAQKLHALTFPGSERAHDLVDIQLLAAVRPVDLTLLRSTCERLFRYRAAHPWPATLAPASDWESLYAEAADGTTAEPDLHVAIEWANQLVEDASRA